MPLEVSPGTDKTDAHYASGCGSGSAYQHVGLSPTGRRTLILKHTTDTTASHCANIDQPVISCRAQQTFAVATMQ